MKLSFMALAALASVTNGYTIQLHNADLNPPVTQEQFDLIRFSAHLSRAAFLPCKTPVGTQFVRKITGTATGYISRDTARNLYAIVMRGSASAADFKTDGDFTLTPYDVPGSKGCEGCTMHHGFQESVRGVLPGILDSVKAEVAQNPNTKILLTGHSLGGTC